MKFNHAALSGSRALLWSEITSPATLNKCSDGTLVGGRPRYTRASLATSGSRFLFCLHHANGFSIRPITGCDRYLCQLCFVGTSFLLIVNVCGLNRVIQALPQNRFLGACLLRWWLERDTHCFRFQCCGACGNTDGVHCFHRWSWNVADGIEWQHCTGFDGCQHSFGEKLLEPWICESGNGIQWLFVYCSKTLIDRSLAFIVLSRSGLQLLLKWLFSHRK